MMKFSKPFWVANFVELLERLAFYAVFIVITLYLSNVWGFTDIQAGIISGIYSAMLYLLPTFTGAYADKIGFRSSIILAFAFLTIGYAGLGLVPTLLQSAGLVQYGMTTTYSGLIGSPHQWSIIPILIFIVIGGAFIKAVISGTIARETTNENRARGYAIFYMMVNIGAFTGKTVVDPLRKSMGDLGLVYLNYFSASMTFLALILVFFLYKSTHTEGQGKKMKELMASLGKVMQNYRLLILMLIVSGFWMIQSQMYSTMPKYVIRMVGDGATPGWYANVNPLVVFVSVNFITSLMKKRSAISSMMVGMFIIPLSALVMSFGNQIGPDFVLGLHPVAFMMVELPCKHWQNVSFHPVIWNTSHCRHPRARKVFIWDSATCIRSSPISSHSGFPGSCWRNIVPIRGCSPAMRVFWTPWPMPRQPKTRTTSGTCLWESVPYRRRHCSFIPWWSKKSTETKKRSLDKYSTNNCKHILYFLYLLLENHSKNYMLCV